MNHIPLLDKNFILKRTESKSCSGISVIYPIRGIDRLSNLHLSSLYLIFQNIFPVEIVVVEEDIEPKIKQSLDSLRKQFSYYFAKGDRNFNKSRAINLGVVKAKFEKIVMLDTDIILPSGYLLECNSILDKCGFAFLLNKIYNLSLIPRYPDTRFSYSSTREDMFSGGSVIFNRKDFFNLGGFNEAFSNYGSEDCEIWDRIRAKSNFIEDRKFPCLHLPHKREFSYSQNVELYEFLSKEPMDNRIKVLKENLRSKYGVKIS